MLKPIFKQNYFEIFSVPISTAPDLSQLKEKNHQLQQQVHPDRFVNSSDAEKREAMQVTSLVNQAFNTLKDPVERLQYMLTLKGVDMNSETDTSMDGAFLMQQMELREEIADVKSQSDPLDVLDTMTRDLKNQAQNLISNFTESYAQDALDSSREIVRKLQFINKAQKEVNEIIEQIEDELI
jgi:molecular chaperone HscB